MKASLIARADDGKYKVTGTGSKSGCSPCYIQTVLSTIDLLPGDSASAFCLKPEILLLRRKEREAHNPLNAVADTMICFWHQRIPPETGSDDIEISRRAAVSTIRGSRRIGSGGLSCNKRSLPPGHFLPDIVPL